MIFPPPTETHVIGCAEELDKLMGALSSEKTRSLGHQVNTLVSAVQKAQLTAGSVVNDAVLAIPGAFSGNEAVTQAETELVAASTALKDALANLHKAVRTAEAQELAKEARHG